MSAAQESAEPIWHRKYVGSGQKYDLQAASQFGLLTALGLREEHTVLDLGCGSLCVGRLLIPYLAPGHYFGIDPEEWLVEAALAQEVGRDLVTLKHPTFSNEGGFRLTVFKRRFDYIIAHSIFSHTSRRQMETAFQEAREALDPQGIFVCTFNKGDEDYAGEEWVYPGGVFFRMETVQQVARDAGLACVEIPWTHHGKQTWVALTHPAHLDRLPALHDPMKTVLLEKRLRDATQTLETLERQPLVRLSKRTQRLLRRLGLRRRTR